MPDIRIIREPSVYLVGSQQTDDAEISRFLGDQGVERWETDASTGAEKLSECTGRICYASFAKPRPGGNAAYLGHILEEHHGNVAEHAVFNLVVTGVSRNLSHEWIRHRVGMTPSQRSQRYVDESDGAFVVPPALAEEVEEATQLIEKMGPMYTTARDVTAYFESHDRAEPSGKAQAGLRWLTAMEFAQEAYGDLAFYLATRDGAPADKTARRKHAREAARSVLPGATETILFVTLNARAARHVLEQRGSLHADAEIARLAVAILAKLKPAAPNLFADISVERAEDGREWIRVGHSKV